MSLSSHREQELKCLVSCLAAPMVLKIFASAANIKEVEQTLKMASLAISSVIKWLEDPQKAAYLEKTYMHGQARGPLLEDLN